MQKNNLRLSLRLFLKIQKIFYVHPGIFGPPIRELTILNAD
jgi:hypothetical protein